MLTARKFSPATKSCGSILQMSVMDSGGVHGDQTEERPHCCPAARMLLPSARAHRRSIAVTVPSSFPVRFEGGTSTCGSTLPDTRNAHRCGPRSAGRVGTERGRCRRRSSRSKHHQTSLPVLDHNSAHAAAATHRVISLDPVRQRRRQ